MKKSLKRAMSFLLTATLLIGSMNLLLNVSAANITGDQPSWYIGNSATNPHSAANWACLYGLNGNFYKMIARTGEKGTYIWHPENETDPEYIRGYALNSSQNAWAVLGYSVKQTGIAKCKPYGSTSVYTNASGAELMVVLKNNTTGRYYPLYPSPGIWEWKTLSGNSASPDIANDSVLFEEPVEKGDTIYYVVRPKEQNETGYVNIVPKIDLTDNINAAGLYPSDTSFTGWENRQADDSLYPPTLSFDVSAEQYKEENIRYGGMGRIVSVPKEDGGTRLWLTATAGGLGESVDNFTLFYYSDDGGATWSDAVMVNDYDTIFGRRSCRFQDHNLYYNAQTYELWLLFTGSTGWYDGRSVTYLTKIYSPGATDIHDVTWSQPRLLMDKFETLTGSIASAPALLSDGTIAISLFNENYEVAGFAGENKQWTSPNEIPERYQVTSVILTDTNATAFIRTGGTAISDVSGRLFDESSIFQKDSSNPNELVMVSRVRAGLAAFESHDKGVTWTQMALPNNSNTFNFWADNGELQGTCSNFVICRLNSGNLLMVYHDTTSGNQDRARMMARISLDNGVTWSGGLLLCESGSSYPSATQDTDGTIHVVFDNGQREIHPHNYYVSFTEADVLSGDSTTETEKIITYMFTGEPIYHKVQQYSHSGLYNAYSDGMTSEDAHSRGMGDIAQFWYQYGNDFNFVNMTDRASNNYWGNSNLTNQIASWYMTASGEYNTALSWHSMNNSNVTYSTTFNDIYLSGGSGKAELMIVQKRDGKYYPLWPSKGEFEWQIIEDKNRINLSGDNTISTSVKPDDDIIAVLRAGSDQITINPVITYTTVEADNTITINHMDDSLFSDYGIVPETISTNIGWFGGAAGNPYHGSSWTFQNGIDGQFSNLENFIASDSTVAALKPGWSADETASTTFIGTWRQQATSDNWAVTALNMERTGNISGGSTDLKTNGYGSGDVMVVLKNSNGFYPVWPTAGTWEWQRVSSTTGIEMSFETGYKSGDTLYYIVKPSPNEYITRLEICPSVTLTTGAPVNYPAVSAFSVWEDIEQYENTIICVGDSITYGVGATDRNTDTYPSVLQSIMGESVNVINFGSSGATMTDDTVNAYTSRPIYTTSLTSAPDTVLLMMGTNDCSQSYWDSGAVTSEKFKQSMKNLIATYEALPSCPEVILMNFATIYGDSGRTEAKQNELLQAINQVAADTGCRLIDIHSYTAFHSEYFSDVLHPNTSGYSYMANHIYEQISLPFYGDVNSDHKVNIKDIVRIKKFFVGNDVTVDLNAANVDRTGGIDALDLTALRKYLLTGKLEEKPVGNIGLDTRCVFSDDFNGSTLDDSLWNYRTGRTWYSDSTSDAVTVENGSLVIDCAAVGTNATSGGIISKQSFSYGYYEARIRTDLPDGWHPSFWTYANNTGTAVPTGTQYTEIDIMEYDLGNESQNYCAFNVHGFGEGYQHENVHVDVPEDLRSEYHVYGCSYTADGITFYMDGVQVGNTLNTSEFPVNPQYVFLSSIARYGVPAESGKMYVDYFRHFLLTE